MRLYTAPFAPNPLKVQILMREKGLETEVVNVTPENRPNYLKINPLGQVPALELDSGEVILESLTICEYLDAVSAPPFLFGEGPEERARIGMWERRAEMLLFIPSVEYGHHTHKMFEGLLAQYPDWAATLVPKSQAFLDVMADRLETSLHLAGDAFTAADITAYLGYFALIAWGAIAPDGRPSIQAWAERVGERDSLSLLKPLAAMFDMTSPPGPRAEVPVQAPSPA